jgi:hypothetical protein
MAKSLLVNPPFTREEWATADLEELADGHLGKRLVDYLCLYTHAVIKLSPKRLHRIMKMAGLPVDSPRPFSLSMLRRVVSRQAARQKDRGVGIRAVGTDFKQPS